MSETRNFLYLSETALAGLGITTKEAVDAIEHLIRGQGEDKVWSAPKAVVQPPDGRYLLATLAAADEPPLMSVKSLLTNPANPERGLKQINAMVTLLDSDTGLPRAVMDGNWITAVRTAALSAVAAKRLARPDTHLAAFIGCGVQAESHLRAFAVLYPLREIRAFGRGSNQHRRPLPHRRRPGARRRRQRHGQGRRHRRRPDRHLDHHDRPGRPLPRCRVAETGRLRGGHRLGRAMDQGQPAQIR